MVTAASVGAKMWFGTRDYSQWIETPLSGANHIFAPNQLTKE